MAEEGHAAPLEIRDYTLTALATGLTALSLRELRERVDTAPAGSLLHHFWGRLLRMEERGGVFGNDLAEWAASALHDPVLAERLALVDPVRAGDIESLRTRIVEVLDQRLEELGGRPVDASPEHPFHFVSDQMVVYGNGRRVTSPGDLLDAFDDLSDESVFLHFVRPPGLEALADLSAAAWLRSFDGSGTEAALELDALDVFLLHAGDVREAVRAVLDRHLDGSS